MTTILAGTAVAVVAMIVAAGCGGDAASSASVKLREQGGSGQTGTAMFASDGRATTVVVELSNPPALPQPSHIHMGTCESPNPQPAFPLDHVVGGRAETTIGASLEELQGGESFYVNVHESEAEIETVVACGDIDATGATLDEGGGRGYGGGGY
jgi:hypothetical protein